MILFLPAPIKIIGLSIKIGPLNTPTGSSIFEYGLACFMIFMSDWFANKNVPKMQDIIKCFIYMLFPIYYKLLSSQSYICRDKR